MVEVRRENQTPTPLVTFAAHQKAARVSVGIQGVESDNKVGLQGVVSYNKPSPFMTSMAPAGSRSQAAGCLSLSQVIQQFVVEDFMSTPQSPNTGSMRLAI